LKPFDRERFERAVNRAKAQIRDGQTGKQSRRIADLLAQFKPAQSYLERLVVKRNGRIFFIKAAEVDWIEAEGNYVRIHVAGESHLLRETLSNLESRLDPTKLVRIHRSAIVNIDRVQEMQPWFHGEYRVILPDGVQLTLTKSYREKLHEQLGISL